MREVKKRISLASNEASRKISIFANSGGMYARGLASEGYNGGYRDALNDVLLLLGGTVPTNSFWKNSKF